MDSRGGGNKKKKKAKGNEIYLDLLNTSEKDSYFYPVLTLC